MIGEEPGLTGVAFQDAYVGAVGEQPCQALGAGTTDWCAAGQVEKERMTEAREGSLLLWKPLWTAPI
jgi:hypothetical protein